MLWLIIGSCLFLLLVLTIGFAIQKKLNNRIKSLPVFESILLGTAAITIYCNVLSFFIPVNFIVLAPLILLAVIILFTSKFCSEILSKLYSIKQVLFSRYNKWISLVIILVVCLFSLVPPYNTDSSGYHILAIQWNEGYKIVPGLANLFPQFGFNSAFMVLSAPFSFTTIAGQSIYPINPVLVLSFLLWLMHKSFLLNDYRKPILWFLLFIFLRQFPINIASPSADALASILVLYCFFTFLEVKDNWHKNEWIKLLLLTIFAITIKISTLPLILFFSAPFILYKNSSSSIFKTYVLIATISIIIFLPWLARNIILSGYLVFPFSSIDLFTFDWKVPLDITIAEKQHVSHAPRLVSDNWAYVSQLPFTQWFPVWIKEIWRDNKLNALMVYITFILAFPILLFLVKNKAGKKYFIIYFIALISIIFWLLGSPDIRFGYHYFIPFIFFPIFMLAHKKSLAPSSFTSRALTIMIILMVSYYGTIALKMLTPYQLKDYIIHPLKSKEYYTNNNLSTFKFVRLNDRIKLYFHDPQHHSLNAPLPSSDQFRHGIKMRGSILQDGFKITPDTIIKK